MTNNGDRVTGIGQDAFSTTCTPTWAPLGITVKAEIEMLVLLPSATTATGEVTVTADVSAHTRVVPVPTL